MTPHWHIRSSDILTGDRRQSLNFQSTWSYFSYCYDMEHIHHLNRSKDCECFCWLYKKHYVLFSWQTLTFDEIRKLWWVSNVSKSLKFITKNNIKLQSYMLARLCLPLQIQKKKNYTDSKVTKTRSFKQIIPNSWFSCIA